MTKTIVIKFTEVVGSKFCTSSEDGQKVYEQILEVFDQQGSVELSFEGVQDLTSAFLNTAVGQLYGVFSETDIRNRLSVKAGEQDDLLLLKRVVDRAKLYFNDPSSYATSFSNSIGNNDDEEE